MRSQPVPAGPSRPSRSQPVPAGPHDRSPTTPITPQGPVGNVHPCPHCYGLCVISRRCPPKQWLIGDEQGSPDYLHSCPAQCRYVASLCGSGIPV
eukprot:1862618-Prymnesium_polylepis.1